MRIALITDGMSPYAMGGMQRHSRMLAEHLVGVGAEVTLFHTTFDPGRARAASSLEGCPEALRCRIVPEFVPYPRVRRFPGHYLAEEWRYSAACLRRYLDHAVSADFIYAQGLTGWAFLRLSQRHDRLPPIGVNTHGYEMFQRAASLRGSLQYALLRPAFRDVNRRADVVFSFSGKIRRLVEDSVGVPAARIVEMPNGVEESWIVSSPPPCRAGARRFIFVGRHDRRKGLPELLAAVSGLPRSGWTLDVVGPVPPQSQLFHPCIRFVGPVSDIKELQALFDGADCLLCPSHAEGMPTVILEAMARGLAIVATDVGATAELVDATNGLLLSGPRTGEIAGAMRRTISMGDPEIMALKRGSLARVHAYSWTRVAAQVVDAARDAAMRLSARSGRASSLA
jgi:glycosyltransferase involved in cell wall biosynthesis